MGEGKRDNAPYGLTLRRLHLGAGVVTAVLAVTGLMIYFHDYLGSKDLKIRLLYIHSTIGFGLIALLCWRIFLFFRGAPGERLGAVLVNASTLAQWRGSGKNSRRRFAFAGRSPLSRTIATVLYLALFANVATGLVRAGTDIFYPPLGPFIKDYIAAPGANPAKIRPGSPAGMDMKKLQKVKRFKYPIGGLHKYGGFIIIGLVIFHGAGVLMTEWSAPNDKRRRGRARIMLFGPEKSPRRAP